MFQFEKAVQPTLYFIGVTTGKSSIMRVFPKWAEALGLTDAVIKGIDLPLHAPAESYREVVRFLKEDPLSLGALVTTHKLDLFAACKDLFDYVDPYGEMLEEVSCLSKLDGKFRAHAKDPISSGAALSYFVPEGFWQNHGGEVLLLGAGGSSLAMSLYLTGKAHGQDIPKKITIANRSVPRLKEAEEKLKHLHQITEFAYIHSPSPEDNDKLVSGLKEYSLVVNATGLGKDAPGSPITDGAQFPQHSLVWEINYRGDLLFKAQAEKQRKTQNLHVEDGWNYFIHGWSSVIAEVFHIEIAGERLKALSKIALES